MATVIFGNTGEAIEYAEDFALRDEIGNILAAGEKCVVSVGRPDETTRSAEFMMDDDGAITSRTDADELDRPFMDWLADMARVEASDITQIDVATCGRDTVYTVHVPRD